MREYLEKECGTRKLSSVFLCNKETARASNQAKNTTLRLRNFCFH
jgi:hypothetical protein